ncbi:hypothetical protein CN151_18215 [Sinorhizobium meliloti]|uniref:hypothetical protein n=1 Tax=Rhizobium meliloti TaxID=382 RepID=UPI00059AEBF9|nr:hypothetical protein [Sinorhizobium meliloti]MDW9592533.1 hypothetical protein [Sinorhizobium meliloti]MDX0156288.1 hypothetical protein [Sinorhizobium meliloti]MDX0176455.1 hypothetical protein [Sinorhizobium meliloti]MDX0188458.1 hypothetical protein [Sinorhizobium meliloti]
MIINLAVWFGLHTLFSKVVTWRLGWFALDVPDPSSLVLPTLVLTAAAAVAIFRYQASIIGTLLAYAVAGLV